VSFEPRYAEPLAIVARPRHPLAGQALSPRAARPPARTLTRLRDAVWSTLQHAVWSTPRPAVQLDIYSGWLCGLGVPVPGGATPVGLPRRRGANLNELAEQLMDIMRELS
jgi:hypothetical protein